MKKNKYSALMDTKTKASRINNSAFIFDLKTLLVESDNSFATPKVSAVTLKKIDHMANLAEGAVAILSDFEIRKMVKILGATSDHLTLIGSHGGERQIPGYGYFREETSPDIESLRDELATFVAMLKPAYIENKPLSIVIHFGAAQEMRRVIYAKLSSICKDLGKGFQLVEGQYCWEIKESRHNKGVAVANLLNEPIFQNRTPYTFGGDTSSESAFITTHIRKGISTFVGDSPVNGRAMFSMSNSVELKNWIKELCATGFVPPLSREYTKYLAA